MFILLIKFKKNMILIKKNIMLKNRKFFYIIIMILFSVINSMISMNISSYKGKLIMYNLYINILGYLIE